MPMYMLCQGMEGLGIPPHAEDEAAPLDKAMAQARSPGLAIGHVDVRCMWEWYGCDGSRDTAVLIANIHAACLATEILNTCVCCSTKHSFT